MLEDTQWFRAAGHLGAERTRRKQCPDSEEATALDKQAPGSREDEEKIGLDKQHHIPFRKSKYPLST